MGTVAEAPVEPVEDRPLVGARVRSEVCTCNKTISIINFNGCNARIAVKIFNVYMRVTGRHKAICHVDHLDE